MEAPRSRPSAGSGSTRRSIPTSQRAAAPPARRHVWRIDFQLGWDADPEAEKRPENIVPRVRALLGPDIDFTLEWASVYTFACQRMAAFRHGRVLFAGDAAHGVSPFGARGANSGVQDADNLAWKLAAVLRGAAGEALLDAYASEREFAADENIRHSTRATDFITPKSEISRLFRDATLALAKRHPFARTLVNSGRLSVATTLAGSPANTPDVDAFTGAMVPGAAAADGPVASSDGVQTWLLRALPRRRFTLLMFEPAGPVLADMAGLRSDVDAAEPAPIDVLVIRPGDERGIDDAAWRDSAGLLAQRYDATPGTAYLLRPDQHVCARWRTPGVAAVRQALRRALALDTP